MVASGTPCEESATVSFSGHCVAAIRRRRSASCSSGTEKWKGRMASLSEAAARSGLTKLAAPRAAEAARKLRRLGDGDVLDMIILPDECEALRSDGVTRCMKPGRADYRVFAKPS